MIILYITIWLLCSVIAGLKQKDIDFETESKSTHTFSIIVCAIGGPITLILYAIRATIFEKWL